MLNKSRICRLAVVAGVVLVVWLLVIKPRVELSRSYDQLVADAVPLVLSPAGDAEIQEIERRLSGWSSYAGSLSDYLATSDDARDSGDNAVSEFMILMTHSAPRFDFLNPEGSRADILRLVNRGIIAPTISDDGRLYFQGPASSPERVFTLKANGGIVLDRSSEELRILVKMDAD